MGVKILVCGSRSYDDFEFLYTVLEGCVNRLAVKDLVTSDDVTILYGDAPGADNYTKIWSRGKELNWKYKGGMFTHKQFYARWDRYGRNAGPRRNAEMINENPDLVLAFIDKPLEQSKGTHDTVQRARAHRIKTHVIESHVTPDIKHSMVKSVLESKDQADHKRIRTQVYVETGASLNIPPNYVPPAFRVPKR